MRRGVDFLIRGEWSAIRNLAGDSRRTCRPTCTVFIRHDSRECSVLSIDLGMACADVYEWRTRNCRYISGPNVQCSREEDRISQRTRPARHKSLRICAVHFGTAWDAARVATVQFFSGVWSAIRTFRDFRPESEKQLQVPPLRCAPVGMTLCSGWSRFAEGNCPVVAYSVLC
jgi:hypothetical protein